MPMRNQPPGVHRARRGTERPPREYDIIVDGEPAAIAERLKSQGEWRFRRDGVWPATFKGPDAFLRGMDWTAELHRAAKRTAEPATATEDAAVSVLSPVVADPFRDDSFADPLA